MGGGHTTAATMLFPGVFDYICPMSCGTEDFAWPGTETMVEILKRNDMEYTLFASDGGHVWYNWRYYLNTFAQLLIEIKDTLCTFLKKY